MTTQKETDFNRITEAIKFIQTNFRSQPTLEEIAKKIHLSPFHFQRLFTDFAGVSPKKFLQYLTVEHAKLVLGENNNKLADAAFETGLSGTARLHDLFVNIEGMTPGEYKNGGEDLSILYSFADTSFGQLLIASTAKGICYMAFTDDREEGFSGLKKKFPKARYSEGSDHIQQNALHIFYNDWNKVNKIKLHLKGTPFQLKVWQTLLSIPQGRLSTYGVIAKTIEKPGASRAVGTAIGDNPVAYLIPCHRVIQSTGIFGGYMWGAERKAALIGWEAAQAEQDKL